MTWIDTEWFRGKKHCKVVVYNLSKAGGEAADAVTEPEPERRSHRLRADRG